MRRQKRYWWIALLTLVVPAALFGFEQWLHRSEYVRPVVWQSWHLTLSQGGAVEYRNQSPRMRTMGPADTTKLLIWTKLDNRTQEYQIDMIGGGYQDLEARISDDKKRIWLIAWDWNQIVATLDLNNGRFTGARGTPYDSNGVQNDMRQSGYPKWATMKGGRSLGRRKFK
jgi:hypothetical protein